jgi:hypothetical protein
MTERRHPHRGTLIAIQRVKDRMRSGAPLVRMHSPTGVRWYVVPGGEVSEQIAQKIIAEPDVFPANDGLFPGIPQTYRLDSA